MVSGGSAHWTVSPYARYPRTVMVAYRAMTIAKVQSRTLKYCRGFFMDVYRDGNTEWPP